MKHRLRPRLAGALLALVASTAITAHVAYAADAADAANPSLQFDIKRFELRGNTLLSVQAIDSLVAPYLGKQRDFADVMGALEALEGAYHARGYQLVRIDLPEQQLDQGVVILNVVPTKIGHVTLEGNRQFDDANIRRSLPDLREGQTPDLKSISKSLKLANENPAKKTIMTMKTGAQDDEVDATLAVTEQPVWNASINLDNTGTAQTGRTHIGGVLQYANLFDLDHVLSLQYTTTVEKPSSVSVYGIGYHIPLYALGDSLDFFGSYSDVDAGTVTAGIFDLAVSGKGSAFGARYNHNLPGSGNYESKLVYGIDYKAYQNNVQLMGLELGNDVTVHPLSIGYQGKLAFSGGEASMGLTLLHNIAGGSRGSQQDFNKARFGASANYTALRFAASVTQALTAGWQARATVNGQYSKDALIPGEQFGAGGAGSVRGFEEREVANDSGAVANFEVYSSPLCRNTGWQCRMLAFYDRAHVTRNHALPGEIDSTSIASAGLGLRLLLDNGINLQMDWGHVLQAGAITRAGDNRLHVRLGLSF
jgi:hemolysin activation/secretion protein